MSDDPTDAELEAYLEESLPPEEMGQIEAVLRSRPEVSARLKKVISKRDAGLHSLGDIWRRHRVSCPSREELGTWLLDALGAEEEAYLRFHLDVVGCRVCKANLADLKQKARESSRETGVRRQRVFQSSAGYLPGERKS